MANGVVSQLESLVLSANEVRELTGWPDEMVEDYITIIRNILVSADASDNIQIQVNQNTQDINELNVRVTANEQAIAALTLRVDQNEIDIDDLKPRVTQNESDIAQNQTDISQNAADIAQNASDISTNAGNISTNTANIATNASDIAQNTSDISDLRDLVEDDYQIAAYGGLVLSTPGTAGSSLGAAWQKLTIFDAAQFSTPKFITQNVSNDSLVLEEEGVYELVITLSFEHNSVNNGRKFSLRLFNETDGNAIGNQTTVYVGRNQSGTFISLTVATEFPTVAIGDEIIIQIGNGDTFTSVSYDTATYYLKSIGEDRSV